jgi:hypothetical protein
MLNVKKEWNYACLISALTRVLEELSVSVDGWSKSFDTVF